MKYAYLDGEKLLGWYSPDINTNIPTPNIEVSDEVWYEALSKGANAYINGQFVFKDFSDPQKIKQDRIQELKQKLSDTDYKDLPGYDKRGTAEWTQLMADRQAWRDEIRQLES